MEPRDNILSPIRRGNSSFFAAAISPADELCYINELTGVGAGAGPGVGANLSAGNDGG